MMSCQNLTELIGRDRLIRLLRLCGAEVCKTSEAASDYEMFRALCRSAEALSGHSLLARAQVILSQCFSIPEPLSIDTCDDIWHKTAEMLLMRPLSQEMLEMTDTPLSQAPVLSLEHKCALSSAFPARLFTRTRAGSFDIWMREIESVLGDAAKRGCTTVWFGLPEPYTDRKPDPYHVDLVLHKPRRDNADMDLLYAQLMRSLTQICQRMGLCLFLRVECAAEDAVQLLSRVEREVGLPTLIWTTPRKDLRDALITWSAQRHESEILAALTQSDYPEPDTLSAAIADWATVYPVGRLRLLTE